MKRIFLSILSTLLCASSAFAADHIGRITQMEGWGYRVMGEEQTRLQLKDHVFTGDVITTKNDSILGITFIDGSVLRLGHTSQATLDSLIYDPNQKKVSTQLKIGKGLFRYVGSDAQKESLVVNTPVATLGIRGTRFLGKVDENGKTMVALEECCVEVKTEAGSVMLKEPQTYSEVASKDAVPTAPVACDIQWISDVSSGLGMTPTVLGYSH